MMRLSIRVTDRVISVGATHNTIVSGASERPPHFLGVTPTLCSWDAAVHGSFGQTASPLHAQNFDTTTHTTPSPQAAAIAQANTALEARDFAKAIALLTPLAAASPNDAHILYDLAYAHESLDHNAEAEANYRAAANTDPHWIEPRLALGLLLARTGHPAEAHVELYTASTIPPATTADNALKARAYRALARLDQTSTPPDPSAVTAELLAALKLSPETPDDIALSAELAVQSKRYPEAEQAYRRLLTQTPDDPAAISALAHVLLLEQKPAEAEPLLTAALAIHPGDTTLVSELAATYSTQGKTTEAIPMVQQLHTVRPADTDIARLLAHLYAQSGDYAKAEPLLATLCRQLPADLTLVDDRADALIHLQRDAEAEALLKPAVAQREVFPTPEDFANAAAHLAFAASENNDPTTALRAIALRDTVLPPSPSSLFLAAISADKLHQVKQAHRLYEQFLSVAQGKFPDQEWQARHRLIALDHMK